MPESPPRKPAVLILVIALAAAGWGWALIQHFGGPAGKKSPGLATKPPITVVESDHPMELAELAKRLPTQRTANLLARLGDILAAARPGEPNQALLDACREALTDCDGERRSRDFALLLDLARAEDAPQIHELFLSLHREGRTYAEYGRLAVRWGELDASGAIEYMESQEPPRMPPHDVHSILYGWGQTDPEAALAWLEERPDIRDRFDGVTHVLRGWMRPDGAAASEYLLKERLQPNSVVEAMRAGAAERIIDSGPDACIEWIASFPDSGYFGHASSMAWEYLRWGFNELPYDTAARIWSKIGNKPWMDFGRFEHFGVNLANARLNREGVAGFANALSLEWPVEKAIPQFRRWHAGQPEEVVRWLNNMPTTEWTAEILIALGEESEPSGR